MAVLLCEFGLQDREGDGMDAGVLANVVHFAKAHEVSDVVGNFNRGVIFRAESVYI